MLNEPVVQSTRPVAMKTMLINSGLARKIFLGVGQASVVGSSVHPCLVNYASYRSYWRSSNGRCDNSRWL